MPRLSYGEKKRILSGLNYSSQSSSSFKIRGGFNISEKRRISSTTSCTSLKSQRKIQPFVYLNSKQEQIEIPATNFGIDVPHLIKSIRLAREKGQQIIGVISVKRLGLRYKFNHAFVCYCSSCKPGHQHQLRDIGVEVKREMKEYGRSDKELYFYNMKGAPLHGYKQIGVQKLRVILVDSSPRLQLGQDVKMRIKQISDKIELILTKREKMLNLPQAMAQNEKIEQMQHLQQ